MLGLLAAGRKSGIVRCSGRRPTDIALQLGEITWAESASSASIESIIRAAGIADADTVHQSLESARRSGSLAGALLESGTSREKVSALLFDHTTSELADLFTEADGTLFEFFEGATHALGGELGWPMADVLPAVENRVGRLSEHRRVVPDDAGPVRLNDPADPTADPGDAGSPPVVLTPEEWRIVVATDGQRGVTGLATQTGWSPFRVRELVAGLVERRLLAA